VTTTFAQLGLPKSITAALTRRGILETFPIQAASIPDALSGRDICGKAPTGSGKTLAFGLPLLTGVESARPHRPRGLVLAPTRELADQIVQELAPLGTAVSRHVIAVYGGVGYGPQKSALRRGADVVVATPGRLEDLMQQGSIDLGEVDVVVIDEADRMADMGFLPAVRRILDATPQGRQTLLFSATLDGDIAVLSRDYQRNPVRHEAGSTAPVGRPASHHFWLVHHHDRIRHTADVIEAEGQSIVFTRTRHGADRLAKQLEKLGVAAVALHGGRSQNQRTRALKAFVSGRASALVATDVAARGIHVDAVAAVVHYDVPGDGKDYLHRSGRTARAGRGGKVVTLVTEAHRRQVRTMARQLQLDAGFEEPAKATAQAHMGSRNDAIRPRHPAEVQGDPAQSVYVANLPWRVTGDDLRTLFSPFGAIHQSTVITDRKTGRSRGFGFVALDPEGADRAVHQLDGSPLDGRPLTVRLALPNRARRSESKGRSSLPR
jgi:superfamily II DNA/RNA helicase